MLILTCSVNEELQSEGSKFPIILPRLTAFYKTILRNFIEREVREKVEFFNINVNDRHRFKNLKSIYSGAKAKAYIVKLQDDNLITDVDLENFKKHEDFNDKHLQFTSMFCRASIKSKNNFSLASFINLFPQISCDTEAAYFEFQNLLDMDLSTFSNNVDEF